MCDLCMHCDVQDSQSSFEQLQYSAEAWHEASKHINRKLVSRRLCKTPQLCDLSTR